MPDSLRVGWRLAIVHAYHLRNAELAGFVADMWFEE